MIKSNYHPPKTLREGCVFSRACLSVHRRVLKWRLPGPIQTGDHQPRPHPQPPLLHYTGILPALAPAPNPWTNLFTWTSPCRDHLPQCSNLFNMKHSQWRIQDFPEGGAWTLQGGREHAKFSRKLHEIERIWTPRGGRASLTPPLDPPMIVKQASGRLVFDSNPFLLKLSMHNSQQEYWHLKELVYMYENQQRFNIQTKKLHIVFWVASGNC